MFVHFYVPSFIIKLVIETIIPSVFNRHFTQLLSVLINQLTVISNISAHHRHVCICNVESVAPLLRSAQLCYASSICVMNEVFYQ